jgi:hypothetical protein
MATQRRRFSPVRPPRVEATQSNRQRAIERDDLYMQLTSAGVDPQRAAEMVESKLPYPDDAPVVRRNSSRLVGMFAMLFGIPLWLEAARFTRDGWILFINWLCQRFSVPWQVPMLDWRVAMALIVILGFSYSYVEMVKQPVRMPRNWRQDALNFKAWKFERRWEAWIVWLVLIASDIGTTYAGAKNPDPSGLALMRDIIASGGLLAAYAIMLTFIPDRLVRFGWRAIKGG